MSKGTMGAIAAAVIVVLILFTGYNSLVTANENINGLLRQFFPKRTDLSNTTPRQLQRAVDNLNNRPRKCLGYRTPAEALQTELHALGS